MCNDKMMIDSYEPPTPRVSADVLDKQTRGIENARSTGGIQHGRDEYVMIVNEARQIVYASKALITVFGDEQFCGKRPGEYLKCVHAGFDNCGSTENCKFCGAANAITDAQNEDREVNGECVVQTRMNGFTATYNFKIRTIPLEIESEKYIMMLLDDIGAEKHRAALERIFFHDILNTATGLKAYLDILKRQVTSEPDRELAVRIGEITGSLIEEIQSQKLLASAENGTLNPNRQIIVSDELVRSVLAQYESLEEGEVSALRIAPFCDSFALVSDETILRRVLGNMVKNAIEASPADETISIGCWKRDERAVFEVHNSGMIPAEAQPRIFNRFFSTKGEGRGLGTYSMKLLAEGFLGGEVLFTSDELDGTMFSVTLPLERTS
jgi:signal transduction histidine kinase